MLDGRRPLLANKRSELCLLDFKAAVKLNASLEQDFVFLGLSSDVDAAPIFSLPVKNVENGDSSKFVDTRVAIFSLESPDSVKLVTKAWSLLRWLKKTRFCPACGSVLKRAVFSGVQLTCPACETRGGHSYYPQLSPVGIALVASADNSAALLIRQPAYPAGMFSCVAGFVDAGESLQECVRREVAEETGVMVDKVEPRNSQHWPFPSGSLMLGCMAWTAESAELQEPQVDGREIEVAKWFSPKELSQALERIDRDPKLRIRNDNSSALFVPPRQAIAHSLIKAWLSDLGH